MRLVQIGLAALLRLACLLTLATANADQRLPEISISNVAVLLPARVETQDPGIVSFRLSVMMAASSPRDVFCEAHGGCFVWTTVDELLTSEAVNGTQCGPENYASTAVWITPRPTSKRVSAWVFAVVCRLSLNPFVSCCSGLPQRSPENRM